MACVRPSRWYSHFQLAEALEVVFLPEPNLEGFCVSFLSYPEAVSVISAETLGGP